MPLSDFRLENQPRSTQILLLVLVALGLTVVFYLYLMKDLLARRAALRSETGRLEIAVAQGGAIASQLERFKRELSQLEERLKVLKSVLPSQKETPAVLLNVQQMAASSSLKIMKFSPRPIVPRPFYVDWPIGLELQGNYDGLGLFFEKISQYTRIVNVGSIQIKAIEGSTDLHKTVAAACTATTFVFKEDEAVKTDTKAR